MNFYLHTGALPSCYVPGHRYVAMVLNGADPDALFSRVKDEYGFLSWTTSDGERAAFERSMGAIGSVDALLIAIAAIVEFPAMMAYTHIRKKNSDRVLLIVSSCFYLLKTGLLALAAYVSVGTWAVYVSSATQMLCYAIFIPASSFFANDSVNREAQVKGQMLLTETTQTVNDRRF